ncbi:MAG: glycosyltransferase [Candidatus Eiseniibacteriota bacterium]|nr:MAG: glycosyltransferase [Candidatus Eisenbacteria bacterium]
MREEEPISIHNEPARARRVLVVSHSYLPSETSAALQTISLVRKLPEAGWTPTVLTVGARWQYLPTNKDTPGPDVEVIRTALWRPFSALERFVQALGISGAGTRTRKPDRETEGDRSPGPSRRNPASLLSGTVRSIYWSMRPTDSNFLFPLFALFRGLSVARRNRPLAVYSIGKSFSSLVAGHLLAKLLRLPHVVEFHDPWTLSPSYGGKGVAAWCERRLEAWTVAGARAVVAKTKAETALLKRGHPDAKAEFFTVPCGFDETNLPEPTAVGQPRSATDRICRVVHTGSLSERRSPVAFLNAAGALLKKCPDLRGRLKFIFAGRAGTFEGLSLSGWCERLGLAAELDDRGWTGRRELLELMKDADVFLLIPDYPGQIPAKLYEYLWFDRPVLVLDAPGSESAGLVNRLGRGLLAPRNEPGAIADALRTLIETALDGPSHRVGADGLSPYSAKGRAGALADILSAVSLAVYS